MSPEGTEENEGFRIVTREDLTGEQAVIDVSSTESELPHWTAPATGQVPSVIASEETQAPPVMGWQGEHDTVQHVDIAEQLAAHEQVMADNRVEQRLGVNEGDISVTDAEYLNFDDVDLAPRRRTSRLRRRKTIEEQNAQAVAALFTDEIPAPAASALPPPPPPVASAGDDLPPPPKPIRTRRVTSDTTEPPSSAGRNLPVAIGVGVAIAVVSLLLFRAGPAPTMLLIEVVIGLAGFEFFNAMQRNGYRPATLLGFVAIVALPIAAYWRGESAIPAIVVLTFFFGAIWFISGASGRARPLPNLGVTLLGVIWIGVFGSFAALIVDVPSEGVSILFLAVIAAVAHDTGGFFIGRAIGRSPLTAVSPNKTVEGLIGGVASTFVAVFVVAVIFGVGPFGAGKAIVLALVLAVVAPIGDLTESMFKRDLGVKDMGSIIPAHGGLLDRFDGLLFVLPATYYVARILGLG